MAVHADEVKTTPGVTVTSTSEPGSGPPAPWVKITRSMSLPEGLQPQWVKTAWASMPVVVIAEMPSWTPTASPTGGSPG